MKLQIDVATLAAIPLRYYRGWTIEFNVQTESFQCPLFCLFGFSNVKDLELAMNKEIETRAAS